MRQRSTPYNSFWDLRQDRSVYIESTEGQAHFFLSYTQSSFRKRPEEWLLLCRYAGTISMGDGLYELRQLDRLARYFNNRYFEGKHGCAYPPAAREVEKEIITRTAPDFAEGYDMTPAMRLLARYEDSKAVFTQPERNLLLTHAFCLGDHSRVEEIAGLMAAKAFTRQRVIEACSEIESAQLGWIGLETMDGLESLAAKRPGSGMDLRDCELAEKQYAPFAYYPRVNLPQEAQVLQNGTLLFPCPAEDGWWRSGFRKVDQTFTVPRHYKGVGQEPGWFEIAEAEYREMYPRQEQQESHGLRMTGL